MAIKINLAEKMRPKTPKGCPCGPKIKQSLRQKLQERNKLRVANSLAPEPDCDLDFENDKKSMA
jgi:hypothetical protein